MIAYLKECLDNPSRTLEYDELSTALREHEELSSTAEFDVFVKTAYYYSLMSLTKAQALRVAHMMRELALNVFLFNMTEADTHSDEVLEAINAI